MERNFFLIDVFLCPYDALLCLTMFTEYSEPFLVSVIMENVIYKFFLHLKKSFKVNLNSTLTKEKRKRAFHELNVLSKKEQMLQYENKNNSLNILNQILDLVPEKFARENFHPSNSPLENSHPKNFHLEYSHPFH